MNLKPPLTYREQICKLKSENILIENEVEALNLLSCISYYRLSGYALSFRLTPSQSIYQNNTLNCFKNNNYTEEKTNMLNVFGTTSCTTTDTGTASETTSCTDTKFSCIANINGTVSCTDITNNKSCKVDQTDSATCGANQ